MSPADIDEYGVGFLEELLAASPEAREAVAGYVHEAYERGLAKGEREGRERLSKMLDGISRTKGNHQ